MSHEVFGVLAYVWMCGFFKDSRSSFGLSGGLRIPWGYFGVYGGVVGSLVVSRVSLWRSVEVHMGSSGGLRTPWEALGGTENTEGAPGGSEGCPGEPLG